MQMRLHRCWLDLHALDCMQHIQGLLANPARALWRLFALRSLVQCIQGNVSCTGLHKDYVYAAGLCGL